MIKKNKTFGGEYQEDGFLGKSEKKGGKGH